MREFTLDHPVKRLRTAAGLTQEQLADKVSRDILRDDLSEQYVRRIEHGLIGQATDVSSVLSVLFSMIQDRHENEGRPDFLTVITQLMSEYIVAGTDLNAPELHCDNNATVRAFTNQDWSVGVKTSLALLVDDWYLLLRLHTKQNRNHTYDLEGNYRTFKQFKTLFLSTTWEDNGLRSTYAFCRALGLHPFTIQRFEQMHGENSAYMAGAVAANWPADLRVALSVIGVDWSQINFTGRDHAA